MKKKQCILPSLNDLNRKLNEAIAAACPQGGVEVQWNCVDGNGEGMTIQLDQPLENVVFAMEPKAKWSSIKRELTSRGVIPMDISHSTEQGMKYVSMNFHVDRIIPVHVENLAVSYWMRGCRIDMDQLLNDQLDEAVRDEDFEVAARLRDMINAKSPATR